jgi:hypothetical protein
VVVDDVLAVDVVAREVEVDGAVGSMRTTGSAEDAPFAPLPDES